MWEWVIPSAELVEAKRRHRISSTMRRSDGVRVRAISDAAPSADAQRVAPTLEDAYLLHIAPAAAESPA